MPLNLQSVVGGAASFASVAFRRGRKIQDIIPDVVIEENHTDELTITDHPIDAASLSGNGAITDHAFLNPAALTMRFGFSNSSISGAVDAVKAMIAGQGIQGGALTPSAVYNRLLVLQASRVPFDILTGKRAYKNMLIKSLNVVTELSTENVLMVTASFRQVMIVETKSVPLKAERLKDPSKASTTNSGTVQAKPVSLLKSLAGG